jgi:hypothetical protein
MLFNAGLKHCSFVLDDWALQRRQHILPPAVINTFHCGCEMLAFTSPW